MPIFIFFTDPQTNVKFYIKVWKNYILYITKFYIFFLFYVIYLDYYGCKKMNKKVFILLLFLFVLMSVAAVSAASGDDNIDTIVSFVDVETIAVANDVDTIVNLNENYSDSNDKTFVNDVMSVAVGENNEIYGAAYESSGSQLLAVSEDNNVLE